MKIKNLLSNIEFEQNGILFNELRNLKQVVALFGKNGSGKTRMLNLSRQNLVDAINETKNLNSIIEQYDNFKDLGKEFKPNLDNAEIEKKGLAENYDVKDNERPINIDVRLVATQDQLDMTDTEYRSRSLQLITNPNYIDVKRYCAKFIKSICRSQMGEDYERVTQVGRYYLEHEKIRESNKLIFTELKRTIKEIMDKELGYFTDEFMTPIVTLSNRELRIEELSDGENELLAFCVYLVLQLKSENLNKSHSLKDKTIFIDEPEQFLHPKAQIDMINGLRRLVGESGQIWVATHSLSILSILNRDEVWLLENGSITSPSINTPSQVLTSLVGESNIDQLENFIASQYEWASIQFALECLKPPTVVSYRNSDPQQIQIDKRLKGRSGIKVLDFGAGKGRVGQEFLRWEDNAKEVYYQPLEVNASFHSELREITNQLQTLCNVESNCKREILDSHEKLNEKRYKSEFDYVLLINVLHELPLNKWYGILNSILYALKDTGHIIILEDQAIPRGEFAHEYGFLILDEQELEILFNNSKLKTYKHSNVRYSDRLTCVEIPKQGSSVTKDSIINSLIRKRNNCKIQIKKLRESKNKSPREGRINSFLSQLYANVSMALDDELNKP